MDGSKDIKQKTQIKMSGGDAQALRLLQLEADIRRCSSLRELMHHCANETRPILGFRQAFVLRRRGSRLRVEAASGVSVLEPNAPTVRMIEATMAAHEKTGAAAALSDVSLADDADYAFPFLLWVPFVAPSGKLFAGLLIALEQPFAEKRRALAERLSDTYRHAWLALTKGAVAGRRPITSRTVLVVAVALIAALVFLRAPLTAIAPVEVVARDANLVTSPLEGVVQEITVSPNQPVVAGDLLVRFEDTELRNAAQIARQDVIVAQSRLASLETGAFGDPQALRDIAIARAELELAEAERDLATERLQRTEIRAAVAGLAIFDDAGSWRGQPVAVGQRIMDIADPLKVEYAIALPVDDVIVLDHARPVRVFLDSAPLEARTADIRRASYHAVPQGDGLLAFDLRAAEQESDAPPPRIGARGTAQVSGEDARLGFILFRRPIAWVRQTFGL